VELIERTHSETVSAIGGTNGVTTRENVLGTL
jgi:hypothetical protein